MSHNVPTAATIAPELVPLLTQWDRVSPSEWRITYSFADGSEASTIVTFSERDGAEGDAPDEVLSQCENRFDLSDAFADETSSLDDGSRGTYADSRLEAPDWLSVLRAAGAL